MRDPEISKKIEDTVRWIVGANRHEGMGKESPDCKGVGESGERGILSYLVYQGGNGNEGCCV